MLLVGHEADELMLRDCRSWRASRCVPVIGGELDEVVGGPLSQKWQVRQSFGAFFALDDSSRRIPCS